MSERTIEAKYNTGETDAEGAKIYAAVTGTYNFGETLEDLVIVCDDSEEVVRLNAIQQIVVKIQSVMRTAALAGKDVQEALSNFVPGIPTPKMSPTDRLIKDVGKLDQAAKEALLAKLSASLGLDTTVDDSEEVEDIE